MHTPDLIHDQVRGLTHDDFRDAARGFVRDLGPAVDYNPEPTSQAFDPTHTFAATIFEPNGFCQSCSGAGWVTWTDRTEGPCPTCQGDDPTSR